MSTKQVIVGLLITLLVGIAIGRFTLPSKIITKVQTVEVEKKQQVVDKKDNSVTTITQTKKPDGSVITVTKIDSNVQTDTKTQQSDHKDTKSDKEVTYDTRSLTISAIAAIRPFQGNGLASAPIYGGSVTYRILGPITVGGIGLSDGTIGGTLGFSF